MAEQEVNGIVCPYCGCNKTKVVITRSKEKKYRVVRRRKCRQCGKTFLTQETTI